MKSLPVILAVSMLLFGCTYYTESYAQYEGPQQNWPVSTGATVNRQEGVPIYYGLPSRPYVVLGKLVASSYGNTLSGLARRAKAHGADAVIFWDSRVVNSGYASLSNAFASGSYYGGYGYASGNAITTTVPLNQSVVGAILIKWK
jgi:hypothetical protein